MKDVILHIGRHKTGTSSIQRFLLENPEFLTVNKFTYARTGLRGIAHHLLAEPYRRRRYVPGIVQTIIHSLRSESGGLYERLHMEIDKAKKVGQTTIISSEAFQNCAPTFIRKLLQGRSTECLCYIRDQVTYLASAYAQHVHATNFSGSLGFYRDYIFKADYFKFLNSWQHAFDGCLNVRIYRRGELYQKDIVSDFLRFGLGLENLPPGSNVKSENVSLSDKIVAFKLHLNRTGLYRNYCPNKLYKALPLLNSTLPSKGFTVDEQSRDIMLRRFAKSNRQVERIFFDDKTKIFDNYHHTANPSKLDNEEISVLIFTLDALIGKREVV